jgi:hypothetical protein
MGKEYRELFEHRESTEEERERETGAESDPGLCHAEGRFAEFLSFPPLNKKNEKMQEAEVGMTLCLCAQCERRQPYPAKKNSTK